MSTKDVFSNLEAPLREAWAARVHTPPADLSGVTRYRYIVRTGSSYPRVILDGSERETHITAPLISRRRHPPAVVIAAATWTRNRSSLIDQFASRTGLFPLDGPHVRYCVQSSAEHSRFARTWGVDADRVEYTPYHYSLSEEELRAPVSDHGPVFAGGDSFRDYPTLVAAATEINSPIRIATRKTQEPWVRELPPNVAVGPLSRREYNGQMAAASVVVLPLRPLDDRGSGQTTYLNAMALGKALVVTEVAGVRDYVTDGVTGLVVPPGDPRQLAQAISSLLQNRDLARAIGQAAQREVLTKFTPERYVGQLLDIADRASAKLSG